jgi:hypothetical protein
VPVDDLAPRGGNFDHTRVARVTFFLEEVGLQRLEVQSARREKCESGQQPG